MIDCKELEQRIAAVLAADGAQSLDDIADLFDELLGVHAHGAGALTVQIVTSPISAPLAIRVYSPGGNCSLSSGRASRSSSQSGCKETARPRIRR